MHPSGDATTIPDHNDRPPSERVQRIREQFALSLGVDLTEAFGQAWPEASSVGMSIYDYSGSRER